MNSIKFAIPTALSRQYLQVFKKYFKIQLNTVNSLKAFPNNLEMEPVIYKVSYKVRRMKIKDRLYVRNQRPGKQHYVA